MSDETADGPARHRVVVVGGGFGGLPACRFLGRKPVDVVLLDRRNHHLFQPLLYHVATGILSEGQIAVPLRETLRRYENIRVELAEVTGFDLDRRVVFAKSPLHEPVEVPYDSLIVAAGVSQSYFGHDELALFAPGMKTLDDALELRRRIFGAFEMAEITTDPDRAPGVADGRRGRRRADGRRDRRPDPRACRSQPAGQLSQPSTRRRSVSSSWTAAQAPLATFGDRLSARAATALDEARRRTANGITCDRHRRHRSRRRDQRREPNASPRTSSIWAAGVQASPLAAMLAEASGAETDRAGRIATLPDLTLPGHPEVFAVGDMVTLNGLPGVAEVAMQGSLHAANTIVRRLNGKDTKPYTYRDLGSVAAIGRFRAICSVRRLRLSGFAAWVVWVFVHLTFLNGFGNRVAALWNWFWAMVGRKRSQRIFSVAHTGGDLSAPESVRAKVSPHPFPALETQDPEARAER